MYDLSYRNMNTDTIPQNKDSTRNISRVAYYIWDPGQSYVPETNHQRDRRGTYGKKQGEREGEKMGYTVASKIQIITTGRSELGAVKGHALLTLKLRKGNYKTNRNKLEPKK